jgi:cytochrome c oxidase subunit I+III
VKAAGDRIVVDAMALPSYGFGHRSLMWWGTLGVIAIEGTVFLLAIAVYLYVWTRTSPWPPDVAPPALTWGTLNLAILLASAVPNAYTKRAAEAHDLRRTRIGMLVCLAFAVAFLVVRGVEFATLNVRWDSNAYGSAVWALLVLHTTHLVTDAYDSIVLAALLHTGPLESRRFVDVAENAFYWHFVVAAYVPIYAVIYLASRFL